MKLTAHDDDDDDNPTGGGGFIFGAKRTGRAAVCHVGGQVGARREARPRVLHLYATNNDAE